MSRNAIYTIMEDSESRNYIVKDGGSLLDAAKLLNRMETIRGRLPKGSRMSVLESMNKDYNFFPIGTKNKLLQPLHEKECAGVVEKIKLGESPDAYIKVDFDTGSLTLLYDNEEETHQVTAPVTALAEAYARSLRKKNSNQFYVNIKDFTAGLAGICEIQLLNQQPEEATQAPKMNM